MHVCYMDQLVASLLVKSLLCSRNLVHPVELTLSVAKNMEKKLGPGYPLVVLVCKSVGTIDCMMKNWVWWL